MKRLALGFGIAALTFAASSAFAATALYSFDHKALPASGVVTSWGGLTPVFGPPQAETIDGAAWLKSVNNGASFRKDVGASVDVGSAAAIITRVKANVTASEDNQHNCVSIAGFYMNRFTLGVQRNGQVTAWINGNGCFSQYFTGNYKLQNGVATTLSLVDDGALGKYEVFADGVSIMSGLNDAYKFSSITTGGWGGNNVYLARGTDGWSAFDGYIGDTYIYSGAMTTGERMAAESQILANYGGAPVPEPGSIVAMLSGLVGLAGFGIRRKK